jgi:hypothetical protein
MENHMEVPQKTNNRPTIHPMIPLLSTYLKEYKPGYNRDTGTPMFISALFAIVKLWK